MDRLARSFPQDIKNFYIIRTYTHTHTHTQTHIVTFGIYHIITYIYKLVLSTVLSIYVSLDIITWFIAFVALVLGEKHQSFLARHWPRRRLEKSVLRRFLSVRVSRVSE